MAIQIGRRKFMAAARRQQHGRSVCVRSRTTCMSDNKAKGTYAGFRFDMRRTGIFALCAVLARQGETPPIACNGRTTIVLGRRHSGTTGGSQVPRLRISSVAHSNGRSH